MNLRRCLWCLLPRQRWTRLCWYPDSSSLRVPCDGSPAFRPAGLLLREVEAEFSYFELHGATARQLHDLRRLAAGLRRLDERAAVHGWLCEGCENRGAEFDPVGSVERGEVLP